MVQIDVNKIVAVDVHSISAEEKEDLYEQIVLLDNSNLPPDKIELLWNVTKNVLKYKGEQVESLLADIDVLATHGPTTDEEAREELAQKGQQIEKLLEEVQAKERELDESKNQIDKLLSEIADLQKDKNELRREIVLIQAERQTALSATTEESTEDVALLKETLQQKNKHILQLLSDMEVMEKENKALNLKLSTLRHEMSEATTNHTKLSGENISLRQSNYEYQETISSLEERITGLTAQISELVAERAQKESQLDVLIDALESRVEKWQEILSIKDSEVAELQAKLIEVQQAPENTLQFPANYAYLTDALQKKEVQIKELHNQLTQASQELAQSTELLHVFREKAERRGSGEDSTGSVETLKDQLSKALSRISFLEDKLNDAEQDAQSRAEEMTEMIIQLREYEDGVYGLADAKKEIKELKTQLNVRDKQILRLIQDSNIQNIKAGDSADDYGEKYAPGGADDDDANLMSLKAQLHQLQQTAINLSMHNFDLKAQVIKLEEELDKKSQLTSNSGVIQVLEDRVEKVDDKRMEAIIEENESLRKGLHEVLESIKSQEGLTNITIESNCLEELLAVLDSRHVNGWYHPAMRLQSALNKLQGNNDALRQQLRECRLRESFFQAELQSSLIRIEELENSLIHVQKAIAPTPLPRSQLALNENTDEIEEKHESPVSSIKGDEKDSEGEMVTEKDNSSRRSSIKSTGTFTLGPKKDSSTQTDKTDVFPERASKEIQSDELGLFKTKETKETFVQTEVHEAPVFTGSQKEERTKDLPEPSSGTDMLTEYYKMREELTSVKQFAENALRELQNKDKLRSDVSEIVKEMVETFNKKASKETELTNELALTAFQLQEAKMNKYEAEIAELRKQLSEKESALLREEHQVKELKDKLADAFSATRQEQIEKRVLAFKETVNGLQNMVKQKEESIDRLQSLLKESHNENQSLLEKNQELEMEAFNIPEHKENITDSKAVTVLIEKWLNRVHALEDEIQLLKSQLKEANDTLEEYKVELHKWKEIAKSVDLENNPGSRNDLEKYYKEIDDLKVLIDQYKDEIEVLKNKSRLENSNFKRKETDYQDKMKSLENEVSRLKQQIHLRNLKKNTSVVKREYQLMDKIRLLEDELTIVKSRERNHLQMRKDKCADEVSRWEEKKRLQLTVDRLRVDMKDKNIQMEAMETQISRLKQIISRMERERITLQRRLKISQDFASKNLMGLVEHEVKDDYGSMRNIHSRTESTPLGIHTPRSDSSASSLNDQKGKGRSRRDLEKAVIALKKVIAKLRSENAQFCHKDYVEQLQKELQKMQESYVDAVDRSLLLEEQLKEADSKIALLKNQEPADPSVSRNEVIMLREQLVQKCELLGKVKVLLQRAMLREKQLMQQICILRSLIPPDQLSQTYELKDI